MSYIGAARAIAGGRAPRVPFADWNDEDSTSRLKDYPPGFPALIAAFRGGRQVEIASAAALGFATVMAAGPVAALVFIATPAFISDYSIVLSEPPFLAILATVLGLLVFDAPAWVVGIACAAGVMVRYVGLFLAGAAVLWYWKRPLKAAMASVPALVVFVAWGRWAGSVREYGLKPHFFSTLGEGAVTVQTWLAPWTESELPRLLLALAMLVLIAIAVKRAPPSRLRRAAGLLAVCFAGMMLVSRIYADDAIVFDDRLLSPLLLLGIVIVASACVDLWPRLTQGRRALMVVLGAMWLAGTIALDVPLVEDLLADGWGYASVDWQSSEIAQWLHGDGRHYVLFSDNPSATYSLIQRPSRVVPDSTTPAIMAEFAAVLRAHPSALIGYASPYSPDDPRAGFFARRLGLVEVLRSDEASVWVTQRTTK